MPGADTGGLLMSDSGASVDSGMTLFDSGSWDSGMLTDSGATVTNAALYFSEICDHADNPNARYVEIHNPNSTGSVDLSTWTIDRFANGQTTSDVVGLTGTLDAGERFVIVMNQTEFETEFGTGIADQASGSISGNGDDVYTLSDNGVVVDIFGEVGVDGSGQPWEYENAVANRNAGSVANTIWTSSEWTITAGTSTASPETSSRWRRHGKLKVSEVLRREIDT